ncbi:RHS repeat-associated core domain-containing protein, partial [Flavobacterium sp.]|uniref:RHS repeat-associated core domain-containing protein n=1 Tax=Flavobacterium sp. TaxID=239 RepID=UPI003D6C424C
TVKIMEENNYYPFGLKHANYNMSQKAYIKAGSGVGMQPPCVGCPLSFKYNYKFNGKELQDELGLNMYDYGSRLYDPARAGWSNMDPLAEKMRRHSPYNYCFDNPVFFIDPDGMAPVGHGDDDIVTKVSNKHGDKHYVQRDVSMKMTLTVVNSDGVDLSKTMFAKASGTVQLTGFSGNAQKDFRVNDVTTNDNLKNVSVDYKVVSSLKDVGKNDHVMMLVNDIPKTGKGADPVGLGELGGRVSAIEVGTIKNNTFNNAATHELGHNLGLEHSNGGLMNPTVNNSYTTNTKERGEAVYNQVGPLQGNGTYTQSQSGGNYNTRIQTQVNNFLSDNKIK